MSSASVNPSGVYIPGVAVAAPLRESTVPQNPALSSASASSSVDTLSIEKEKSAAEPNFLDKIFNWFSPKDSETETSKESGLTGFFNRVFKTKDESGKEISRFAAWQTSISKLFKGSEGPRLSRFK